MKLALMSSLFLVLSANVFAQTDPNYYPILCRSGKGISVFAQRSMQTLGGNGLGSVGASERITFAKNATAAKVDGSGLQPGTCAWVDRPLNASEPNVIYETYSDTSTLIITYQTGQPVQITPATAALDNDAYPGKIFRAQAHSVALSPGNNVLQVQLNNGLRQISTVP